MIYITCESIIKNINNPSILKNKDWILINTNPIVINIIFNFYMRYKGFHPKKKINLNKNLFYFIGNKSLLLYGFINSLSIDDIFIDETFMLKNECRNKCIIQYKIRTI